MKSRTILLAFILMSAFLSSCTKDKLPQPNLNLQFELDAGESITLDNQLTIEFSSYAINSFCRPELTTPCERNKGRVELTVTTPDGSHHHVNLLEDSSYSESEEIEGIVIKLWKLHILYKDIDNFDRAYIDLETIEI